MPRPMYLAADEERRFLLFSPGIGWTIGCYFDGAWRAWIDLEIVLRPAAWLEVPPDPVGAPDELRHRLGAAWPPL